MKILLPKFLLSTLILLTTLGCSNLSAQIPSLIPSGNQNNKTQETLKHDMFVKVILSKTKIFVGEPVMALYKFYTSVNGQAVVLKQPTFSGCSVKELNFRDDPDLETVDGKTYTTYIVRKVQLTPVAEGSLPIGIATITNHVTVQDDENSFVINNYDITINSTPENVTVLALPDKNKPSDFYGITGLFNITASVEKSKIPVGENDHLIIKINGAGNLDAINKPTISWVAGTEHFDGTDSQHIDQNDFPISGDRVFNIPFIGKKEGKIEIPSISFSFFNTALKEYQTITTKSIDVLFTKALARQDEFTNIVSEDISNRRYLWIVPAIAVIVALVGFISYRRSKIQVQKQKLSQTNITPVPVFESTVKIKFKTDFASHWDELQTETNASVFFNKAKTLLLRAIAEYAEAEHYSELFLLAEMKKKLKDEMLCNKVFKLVEVCNEKIYAPFATDTDLEFYFSEVKETVEELQVLS